MTKDAERVTGWWLFAGIVLFGIAGILNIIYGIGAIDDATFFVNDAKYILGNLHTWGWVTLIIGVIQLIAAFSLWSGRGLRPLDRDLRGGRERHRGAAVDPGVPLLVTVPVRPCAHRALPAGPALLRSGRLLTYGHRGRPHTSVAPEAPSAERPREGTHHMGLLRHHDEPQQGRRFQMREKIALDRRRLLDRGRRGRQGLQGQRQGRAVRDTFMLEDADGNEVAKIQEKKLSVRDTMTIERGGETPRRSTSAGRHPRPLRRSTSTTATT